MTERPGTPSPAPGYRLRTLGTLALAGPNDETLLGKHGHQRRRLALIAVLAASGEHGRSRDQLLLLFWPDATQTRARHSLDQLLYAIRTSIHESVFEGANPLRLDTRVISSDIGDFNTALERGDLEGAVAQYRGRFLDGFYLADSPEFEQWLDGERTRLEHSYSGALEKLAKNAETAGDHAAAVRWWEKLVETDPVSSRNATGFMRALMSAGDHASALQYAEKYESIVRQELGTSAGPAIGELVEAARAKSTSAPVIRTAFVPAPPRQRPLDPIPAPATAQVEQDRDRKPHRTPVRYVTGAAAVAILIAFVLVLNARRDDGLPLSGSPATGVPAPSPSIAVLPFVNVSRNQNDAALVDGITEELIGALARIRDMRVIARTSAFAFRDSGEGIRSIADSLGVSNILEGSVQRSGERVRVQVRLVDARDGSTRWSEAYDRELRDIFAVQREIATAVARELHLRLADSTLARIERGLTSNLAAYELYLRGNDPALIRSDSGARQALDYFRQAVALDTNFSAGYAGLARMYLRTSSANLDGRTRRQSIASAEEAALKALALDESSAEAHATLGLVRRLNYDFGSAEKELRRAADLDPATARYREWLTQLYVMQGRPAEALAEAERAVRLDPLSPTAHAELAHALVANNQCDQALVRLEKLKSLRPPLLRASGIAAECYIRAEKWPEAIAELKSRNAGPRGQATLAYVLARSGQRNEARQILASLLDRHRRTGGGAFEVALVHMGLRDNDQAFAWLDRAVEDRSLAFDWTQLALTDLREDPRHAQLLRRVGLQSR